MKNKLILFPFLVLTFCTPYNREKSGTTTPALSQNEEQPIKLLLTESLENRRNEFLAYIDTAEVNIEEFTAKFGWQDLIKSDHLFDSAMIFDEKIRFDRTLLKLAQADTTMELPREYCAALEKRTLLSMTPEYYAAVYPEGIEEKSYEKLLTHEIAHQLHILILNGDEDAMGPIWFFEGFAMYVADQFSTSDIQLAKEEMIEIMENPDRGSYVKYSYIFRYFVKKIPHEELVFMAKNEDFNKELIGMIE